MDDDLRRLFELYESTPRQGPGSAQTTRKALGLLPELAIQRVLDLGCGTGGSTIVLAQETTAHVTAVDIHGPFLETLEARARELGLADRITTKAGDMAEVASLGDDFDLIWAEGSAYSIGFENALSRWRPLLRPAGCLVVTELVWFTAEPDERAVSFFTSEYPDMKDEAARIADAKRLGYDVVATFRLPSSDWRAYYAGLEAPLREAIAKHGELKMYAAMKREAEIYERYGDSYGYVCLVMQTRASV